MEARVARLTGQVPSGGGASTSGSAGAIRRVYVGGMPFSYDEDAIRTYWEYCGEVDIPAVVLFVPFQLGLRCPSSPLAVYASDQAGDAYPILPHEHSLFILSRLSQMASI